jgi:F0F1-type ATP synthase delta subunit
VVVTVLAEVAAEAEDFYREQKHYQKVHIQLQLELEETQVIPVMQQMEVTQLHLD